MEIYNISTLIKQSIILSSKLYNKIIISDEQYSIIYYGTEKAGLLIKLRLIKQKRMVILQDLSM